MTATEILSGALAVFEVSKYPLLFAGSYLEGTAVMLTGGILWHLGTVAFWPAYVALLLGDFLADLMWYAIGYFAARPFAARWGHHFGVTPEIMEKAKRRFHRHHTWILIISKLTMGFGLAVATLTVAGMMRVSIWRFVAINLFGGMIWVFAVMFVGYHFGNVLLLIPVEFRLICATLAIAGFFLGIRALSKRLAAVDW